MPKQHTPDWTADAAMALPSDGNRYEVLGGELFVTPAPSWQHQSAVSELESVLRPYVGANQLGWLRHSPADIVFAHDVLLQPDLFIVPARDGPPPRSWSDVTSLLLAVEVLSPATARADRHHKRLIYQAHAVPEYWIVDVDAQCVERWRPRDERPEIVVEQLVWQPRTELAPLVIDLRSLFSDICG